MILWAANVLQNLLDFSNTLNASIAASWLILVLIGLRPFLKQTPKWLNVALWGIVALRLLMPFSIESVFSLIPSVHTIPDHVLQAGPVPGAESAYLDIVTNPGFGDAVSVELDKSISSFQWNLLDWNMLWFVGMAVMAVYTCISYHALRRKLRFATRLHDSIFQCEALDAPFVLGILRPRIYLPYKMSEQDLNYVVAHEQAHIRRKDHWWKPLGFLILTVHCFNPLIWVAYVLLCRDIELACDEKVIGSLAQDQRADYMQSLLSFSIRRRRIAACPLAFGEVGVTARVQSILQYKKPAIRVVAVCVVLCAVIALCFLTDPVRPSLDVLPEIHSHSYGVVEVTYKPMNISMTLTPQVNTPEYAVTESMELIQHWELTGSSGSVGTLEEFELTRENFDDLFYFEDGWNSESAASIRRNTARAWMTIHNQSELYYVLQMKNGELFLAYGYYDYSEKDDPGSDDTAIHWLFRIAIDVTEDYGVIARSGENVVPLTVFPEGTAIGNYATAVHWLNLEPGEDYVPFRTYKNGTEFRGHYLVFDAKTYQELSYHVPSGLDPQTYLFQNADPEREYIVLVLTGEQGDDQYCFGVRFPEDWKIESVQVPEPMINIGGFVYISTGEAIPMEVDPSAFRKKISFQVNPSEEPTQDGQANFDCVGADVVWVEGDYALLLDGEWIRFRQREYPKYYLTVGKDGIASISIIAGGRTLLACPEDFGVYEKGEKIWLEGLDGLKSLRGVTITARDGANTDVFSVRIADSHYQSEDTIVCDDWIITREME